jgi:ABC-type glycerol-3-phosphate transport system substrate-binding protein
MLKQNVNRRTFLRGMAVAGLGAASVQLLAACPAPVAPAGSAPSTTDAGAAPAATDVTLRVQVPPEAGQSVMPTILAERYQADSGVTVLIEETIYGEIETKTQTGFISGTLQDLLYGHHRWLFINYLKGIYQEIDDLLASDPPADYADMYPSIMAGNALDGKNFSVPGVVHPGGNIAVNYNKTLLAEKGLPEPQAGWTINDWAELAKAAADPAAGIFGIGLDSLSALHYYSNFARSWGKPDTTDGWVMNQEGTQLTYNTDLHDQHQERTPRRGVGAAQALFLRRSRRADGLGRQAPTQRSQVGVDRPQSQRSQPHVRHYRYVADQWDRTLPHAQEHPLHRSQQCLPE